MHLLRRIAHLAAVLVLVSFAATCLLELVPGDPVVAIVGDTADPAVVAQIRSELGFDQPLVGRYADWLGDAVTGDLGRSYRTRQPVTEAILDRAPITIELAVASIGLALLIALPVALASAHRQGGRVDRVASAVASASLSMPSFLVALLLVFVVAITFRMLPVTGWVPFGRDPVAHVRHAALPVVSLALSEAAILMRLLRADLITTLQEDYVLAADAKGLPARQILLRHALRPSSLSLVTVAGITLGRVIGGTVVVETVFALPGLGSYVYEAIFAKDLIAVQGAVVFIAVVYVLVNALVEQSYRLIDPRVRAQ